MLRGFDFEFAPNTSSDPGSHHFSGLVNPDLVRRIGAWTPDVVLINGYNYRSHLSAIWKLHRAGIPILFRGDSHLLSRRTWLHRITKQVLLRTLFSLCNGFLYCGAHNREYFKAYGVTEKKLFFCPHVVDNDFFAANHEEALAQARSWRRSLGIDDRHKVVLFAAKLQRKKGPHVLLDAFSRINSRGMKLVFVGDGEMKKSLEMKAKSIGERVFFIPFQNQSRMPTVYRLGEVYALPSLYDETWGLAVNEAMCCRIPVIVSPQVGCGPDLVEPGVTGWATKDTSAAALADTLETFDQTDLDRNAMGAAAQRKVMKWNIPRAGDSIVAAAQTVTTKGRRRLG